MPVTAARLLSDRRPPDLVLLVIEGRSPPRVRLLADCLTHMPLAPVILLATHVDAGFAVELVKCGAEDLLVLPLDPEGLRGKVLRALLGRPGPAYGWPILEPLTPRAVATARRTNVRRCYRAEVPTYLQAVALVGGKELAVRDVSVEVGEWPGGMLLEAPAEAGLPIDEWSAGSPVPLVLRLDDDPAPIAVLAHMRGTLRAGGPRGPGIGVQFTVRSPADRARLQRFWMQCQRPVRKP